LEQVTTFAFVGVEGSFTARKERRGRTGWYWKAYRKRAGMVRSAYLGKSADLTLDRLNKIARDLAQDVAEPPTVESASVLGLLPAGSADDPPSQIDRQLPAGTLTFCFTDIEGSTQLWEQHPQALSMDAQPARSPAPAAPLLATKLYTPALRLKHVPRPRLLERVQAGVRGKLTLIAAPAGFGKSTLLSAWLAARSSEFSPSEQTQNSEPLAQNIHVAWISLDAEDNDPTRFWSYVFAALETLYPAMDTTAGALLRSPQPPPMDVIVSNLINAITPMTIDATLILDDYHLIRTPAIHEAFTFLLDHLPAQLHLIMLTRADPPLPLTRLRSRGELTELRAADLRFTADEAVAFLTDVMELPLTGMEVAALETRTEGWIAGLQLAALAMQNRSDHAGFVAAFSGNNRFVVDYLVEEVLARIPAHLQMFLLQTSILDRLCAPLCDAILLGGAHAADHGAQAYSQLVLEEIERVNLFLVPLDDQRHWYRYHHLFAEMLQARLRNGTTAGEVKLLHQRASAWHAQAGLIDEAVRYAFLAQDSVQAALLIEQHGMAIILSSSDVSLVRAWVEQVPRALIATRPRLVVITGIILGVMRQFDAVERLLADAAPALSTLDLSVNTLGELATLRSTIARFQSDTAGTLTLAQQALEQLDYHNHGFRAIATINMGIAFMERGELVAAKAALAEAIDLGELGGLWIALAALEELMSLQLRQGLLREMRRTSAQAIELSARQAGRRIPATGMGCVGIAEVDYQRNELAGAMHAATQGVELLRGATERLLLVRGYIVLAQICQTHGDRAGALENIERGEAWLAQTQITVPKYLGLLAAYRTRLWLQQGNLAAAARWAQECVLVDDREVNYIQRLTLVRVYLAHSRHNIGGSPLGDAHATLAQLLPAVEAQEWTRYLIEGLLLQALLCQAQADQTSALATLQRALTLAEPEGYVRLFVDEGAPMRLLIADYRLQISQRIGSAAGQDGHRLGAYLDTLLAVFSERLAAGDWRLGDTVQASSPRPPDSGLVEPLSGRELEILRLIAEGLTNQAIADRLIVAVSTVKKHVNNIYGKLDVQSRTQALARARDLHLL
jgi:LuxR family maltose regulon positive regulatory protein